MKFVVLLCALSFGLFSCGKDEAKPAAGGACASAPILGAWVGAIAAGTDTLSFNADCSGSSHICQTTFTYPNITTNSGVMTVTVAGGSGISGCLTPGSYNCAYGISGNSMAYDCGGGAVNFSR